MMASTIANAFPVHAKDDTAKLSITYHLESENGNMIAEPYYADMEKGSSYEVVSPEIENYNLQNIDQKVICGVLEQDTEIKVIYSYDSSKEVDYKINYIGIDSRGNQTELETVKNKAPANTLVSIPANEYNGYEKRTGQNMQLLVTEDGKAEKNVYYDKVGKSYIIFQTQGSYIAPIMAEAGDNISELISKIPEPTREGYEFDGWDREIPTIMPNEDYIINAKWKPSVVEYTVLYWFENADDDDYTLGKNSEKRTAVVGTKVTANTQDIAYGENDENSLNNEFYGFNYSHCDDTTVSPDGTSVLNVYYDREIWKINYMEDDGKTVWSTIEGKYMSKIGDKLISDGTLKEHYGSNFAYMAKTHGDNDTAMLERFENSKISTTIHGEQNIFPCFSNPSYKYTIRQFCQDANSDEILLINTSYIYYDSNTAPGVILYPPEGFKWDGGYWKTAKSESALQNAKENVNPKGTGSAGEATFYSVYQYMDIYMSRVKSTLTYISNGEQVQKIQNVPYEKNIDLSLVPDNGKENMQFVGWYYNPVLMNSEEPLDSYTMPAKDLTLYAKWEPVDKVVQFDTQGGSVVASQNVPYNSKATMPDNPTKSGYTFTGWYTSPDGENRWSFDRLVEKDITLYAHWKPISKTKYTVRHVMQGQENAFFEENFDGGIGDTVTAFPLNPKHEKYPNNIYLKTEDDSTSKSLLLKTNENENVITFTYIDVAKKDYIVKYLNKVTNEEIAESKKITTLNTIVTEDAIDISNYLLDSNSRIVQNVKENSEIIFYYIPSDLKVSYNFVDKDGLELPNEVKNLTPTDSNKYVYGSTVPILKPTNTVVEVDGGRWVFKGYTGYENDTFIIQDNTSITGVWEFVYPTLSDINNIPVIKAEDKELMVGDYFDPRKDVSATDIEDGDLTSVIEIVVNTVDTTKVGTYYVTYKVTDKDGASYIKTIKVVVKNHEILPEVPIKPEISLQPEENPVEIQDSKIPQTGDTVNILQWSILLCVGLAGIVIFLYKKKK